MSNIDLEENEKVIVELHNKILDYITALCKDKNYSAQDLYIALAYTKYKISKCLGPKLTKVLDESFIIDLGETKGEPC